MQNSEEYNNKGGCKNKKVRAGVPSLGELRPHHMCLASLFAHVLAAERHNDEKWPRDSLFFGTSGRPVGADGSANHVRPVRTLVE